MYHNLCGEKNTMYCNILLDNIQLVEYTLNKVTINCNRKENKLCIKI